MKNTRYANCNFKRLQPYIDGMNANNSYRKFESIGFEPLVIEYLHYEDRHGNPVFSVAHYYEQYGDLMKDPDITIAVDFEEQTIEPLTYEQSDLGIYQEVYIRNNDGKLFYSERLRNELDDFLRQWLNNIKEQGFMPDRYITIN